MDKDKAIEEARKINKFLDWCKGEYGHIIKPILENDGNNYTRQELVKMYAGYLAINGEYNG